MQFCALGRRCVLAATIPAVAADSWRCLKFVHHRGVRGLRRGAGPRVVSTGTRPPKFGATTGVYRQRHASSHPSAPPPPHHHHHHHTTPHHTTPHHTTPHHTTPHHTTPHHTTPPHTTPHPPPAVLSSWLHTWFAVTFFFGTLAVDMLVWWRHWSRRSSARATAEECKAA